MDQVERLTEAFHSYRGPSATAWKLDTILGLCALRDERVPVFLARVLGDNDEPLDVRLDVLTRLRAHDLTPAQRALVASTALDALGGDMDARLRLHAALALGDFTDAPRVIDRLGAVALGEQESFDLRYAAFSSLERAGPTGEVVAVLRQLTTDEVLGRSAASMLQAWHVN